MTTVLFVNATIVFSENLFLVRNRAQIYISYNKVKRGNFKPALSGVRKFATIATFQISISKIIPDRPKPLGMGCEYHYSSNN